MSLIGVECNADWYFFGRLLNNKNLIRKERNDTEVIRSIVIRSKGSFCIGIIDVDKNKKIPLGFINISASNNADIYKHSVNCQFLILIGPRQFEHWINAFLTLHAQPITNFGYANVNEFMEESKTINPEKNEKFRSIINFVLENYSTNDNHVLSLKKQLEYIVEKKYQFNIDEFQNI